ncbi:MAG: glycoside hydrolase family 28 protein, partial [Victivallales bacterium]|nr:glycoside hydrolase family 28 protein [Victivallales bacterium]
MDTYFKNVKDFGAVGDGIANDTAAIQRALDAGGAVYVPGGTYRTGTLYLRSNG